MKTKQNNAALAIPSMHNPEVSLLLGTQIDERSHQTDDGIRFTPAVLGNERNGKKFGILVEFNGTLLALSEQLYKKATTAEARINMEIHSYQKVWDEKRRELFRAKFEQ